MSTPPPPRSARKPNDVWRGVPVIVVALGLTFSALLYANALDNLRQRQRAYFDYRVAEALEQIDARMKAYQQLLRGVRGLFETQVLVTRTEFRRYYEYQELSEHYPGIQGVGFARLVLPQDRAAHLADMRREGFPAYQITPPGERPLYTSIVFLEPFSGRNLRAFGYDMYSEVTRREAMDQAAASGKMTLSGKVRLAQQSDPDEQPGFLIYQAVYRGHDVLTSAEERRERLIGWVYAPFRMNDFLHGLFSEHAADLHITVYDGERPASQALMHDENAGAPLRATDFRSEHQLRMMGHVWTVQFQAAPSLLLRVDNRLPALIGVGAALLSLLLGALVWTLVTGRERALATAERMTEALREERARLSAILEGTRVGTWEWNVQTGETIFNEQWARIVGYTLAELEPVSINTWLRLTHPDDIATSDRLLQQHFRGEQEFYECEARMRHKDGHWVWILDRGKVTSRAADGKPLMMYGTHQDITLRKAHEDSLRHGAQHDHLTGLPNRLLLADRLQRALLSAQREGAQLALMYLDIDGFKSVNDNYGHDAGDVVLRTMARRIQSCIRATDTLARVGGDEFVVLLPAIGHPEHAQALARKIAAAARRPIELTESASAVLSLSIGIALYPQHGWDSTALTERADQAMYQAKKGGKDAIVLHGAD